MSEDEELKTIAGCMMHHCFAEQVEDVVRLLRFITNELLAVMFHHNLKSETKETVMPIVVNSILVLALNNKFLSQELSDIDKLLAKASSEGLSVAEKETLKNLIQKKKDELNNVTK